MIRLPGSEGSCVNPSRTSWAPWIDSTRPGGLSLIVGTSLPQVALRVPARRPDEARRILDAVDDELVRLGFEPGPEQGG